MADMNTMKHSNIARSYGQVSGESPFEHVVYRAVTVACTVKEASSGSMWLPYYFQVTNDLSHI